MGGGVLCSRDPTFIQHNGAAPEMIHTERFFVLIPLKWLEKLTGVKDKYI